MKRSEHRILTTHVGSLIRPQALLDFAAAKRNGEAYDEAAFEQSLRESVAEVARKQAEVGLDVINDGEFGKSSWANYILERISGFEIRPEQRIPLNWLGRDRERFRDFFLSGGLGPVSTATNRVEALTAGAEVCVAPIKYEDHHSIQRDVDNLKAAVSGLDVQEAFLTTVAPASSAYNGVNEYYPSEKDYVFAIAEALREEYQAVYKSGLLLQVDDAVLANMYDHLVEQSPDKYREWAQLRVDALNHALSGIPEDRVRYHICFGSWHVPHVSDAPLSEMVDLILQVKAGAYSIEAANVRHEHEWRIWEDHKLPNGRILIPGVITHHTTSVEHPQLVADRIVRFAGLVGRENVIAGTDCGFAQGQGTQRVHPTIMWAKYQALVEGAQIATRQLWA